MDKDSSKSLLKFILTCFHLYLISFFIIPGLYHAIFPGPSPFFNILHGLFVDIPLNVFYFPAFLVYEKFYFVVPIISLFSLLLVFKEKGRAQRMDNLLFLMALMFGLAYPFIEKVDRKKISYVNNAPEIHRFGIGFKLNTKKFAQKRRKKEQKELFQKRERERQLAKSNGNYKVNNCSIQNGRLFLNVGEFDALVYRGDTPDFFKKILDKLSERELEHQSYLETHKQNGSVGELKEFKYGFRYFCYLNGVFTKGTARLKKTYTKYDMEESRKHGFPGYTFKVYINGNNLVDMYLAHLYNDSLQ